MASPLPSGPFPGGDWVGSYKIGANNDPSDYGLQRALGLDSNKNRIKIYGWLNPSVNLSSSRGSNIPVSYSIIPNSFQLSQAVIRLERQPNTIQTDHFDWGFRLSNVYGIDYRYTVAKGWLSDGFFKHNNLYGYDPVEFYAILYFPRVAKGMVLRIGRFISPADIEAQLSPDNYLYTHSVMFSYDPYTETGIQSTIMLNPQWTVEFALHAGNDLAPWSKAASLKGQAYMRYVSRDNNNSIWAGVNAIGIAKYADGHDNLNHVSALWGHRFNKTFHMMTEFYYEWERDAAYGGSASYGPVQFGAGGSLSALTYIPGRSSATGFVNYFQILCSSKSYISIRNDYLNDLNGWRTGYATEYMSHTVGYVHHLSTGIILRPEIRYDHNLGSVIVYDSGAKRDQFTANMDLIVRF